jgi:glycerol kinase
MLAVTRRQAGASGSPVQSQRSTHWIWSNGIGRRLRSTVSWTSLRAARAISASERTHSDRAASDDQITTTALAARNCSSITSA